MSKIKLIVESWIFQNLRFSIQISIFEKSKKKIDIFGKNNNLCLKSQFLIFMKLNFQSSKKNSEIGTIILSFRNFGLFRKNSFNSVINIVWHHKIWVRTGSQIINQKQEQFWSNRISIVNNHNFGQNDNFG